MVNVSDTTIYEVSLLLTKADRSFRLAVSRQLEPIGVSMMQWLLMSTVGKGPVAGLKMREVADALNVTMPQITALMNDLIKKKLVAQKVNKLDKRSRKLVLTTLGAQQLKDIEPKLQKAMAEFFDKKLTASEVEAYFSAAAKLA